MSGTWRVPPTTSTCTCYCTCTVQNVSDENNPRVFMDLSFNGGPPERIVIELYANVVPKTAENFRAFCTGEKGISKTTGRPLHYKGSEIHLICKGLCAHGGDLTGIQDVSGGESIYGGFFEDENFQLLHTEPGLLSMGNRGPNSNGCRFYMTLAPLPWRDRIHVVFGKVIEGMATLWHINEMGGPSGVRITDCGQIPEDKGKKEESSTRASSVDERVEERAIEREKRRNSDQVPNVSDENNPRVFLDLSFNGGPPERMVIELYANVVPKTAENFRALCTGEKGISKTSGRPLHYKGTVFHAIWKGMFACGGDLSEGQDYKAADSIYGGYFEDENFQLLHTEPGLLSMSNIGPDKNGSRFFITFAPVQLLDKFHVVFGKVIEGMSTVYRINQMVIPGRTKLSGVVRITDCGQIPEDKGKKEESSTRASSVDERVEEHTVEREKRRKSDQDRGFPRAHPRQKVGDDSVKELSSQQIEWIAASIREIARQGGFNIPEYPDS